MKFTFFGTPYVARDTLEILKAHGIIPALIVTSPDRPQGRGMNIVSTPVKMWADENHIPSRTPEKLDTSAIREITAHDCEYAIVVAYGKIFPQELIDAYPKGVINIHYSLLPKYRGATPVEAALLYGDKTTGVTIQKMVRELDAGDILAVKTTVIGTQETTRELRARLITLGAELLADILPKFEVGEITPVAQDHTLATRTKKIEKSDGFISLSDDPETNWRKYRAYKEAGGVSFEAERAGKRIRVGVVEAHFTNAFIVDTVRPAGKRDMPFEDFLRSGAKPL